MKNKISVECNITDFLRTVVTSCMIGLLDVFVHAKSKESPRITIVCMICAGITVLVRLPLLDHFQIVQFQYANNPLWVFSLRWNQITSQNDDRLHVSPRFCTWVGIPVMNHLKIVRIRTRNRPLDVFARAEFKLNLISVIRCMILSGIAFIAGYQFWVMYKWFRLNLRTVYRRYFSYIEFESVLRFTIGCMSKALYFCRCTNCGSLENCLNLNSTFNVVAHCEFQSNLSATCRCTILMAEFLLHYQVWILFQLSNLKVGTIYSGEFFALTLN